MNGPLLSICIPTYNRAEFLKRACNSIFLNTDSSLLTQFEVCISDNHSKDETKTVVSEFSRKYPGNIIYNENDKNYGAVFNQAQAFKLARGQYLLCIGDDDLLIESSLGYLLKVIKKLDGQENIKLIFTKFNSIINSKVVFKGFELLDSDKIYDKKEIEGFFVKDKFWCNGFSGAQVFHRNLVHDYFDSRPGYSGFNQWPQLSLLLHSFREQERVFVTSPVILQTGDGLYWLRSNWILLLFQKVMVLDEAVAKNEISRLTASKICTKVLFSYVMLKTLVSARIEDPVRFKVMSGEISSYRLKDRRLRFRAGIFKLMLAVFILIPKKVLEAAYFIYKIASRKKDFRIESNILLSNKREGLSVT